jgi:putative transposase
LLDQVANPIASFTADGAYDQDGVYRAVAARHPDAAVIVPPRSSAVPNETAETAPTQRDQHLRIIAERGRMGWQKASGYNTRALVEADISRFKGSVSARARRPDWPAGARLAGSGARGPGMDCVACGSAPVTERPERTARGYRRFRCRDCGKQYNERSDGVLNHTQYPSAVITLVVLWRLRYRLTLRDLSEMFLTRGIIFSHEAVRGWEAKLAPVLADELRRYWHGKCGAGGRHWHVDEAYLRVRGRWAYLYRAIDGDGNLVDTMLREHRDMAAAQAFFRSAKAATGVTPERVTTDGHGSYPRAIRSALGRRVVHRTSAYNNNGLEQDHRA